MKLSKRGFLVTVIAMAAVILVLGGTTISGYVQAARYKRDLGYTYDRAMSDLKDCVVNIETTLDKSGYANTPTQQNGLAAKLMRETSMAKSALSTLPLSDDSMDKVNKFITQVGDFSLALSTKTSAGETIGKEEYQSLEQLFSYAKKLRQNLEDLKAVPDAAEMTSHFNETADDFTDYPTLIYDGPFSDHIGQRKPKLLEGKSEVVQAQAQANAADFLGVQADALTAAQSSDGGLPCFNFTGENSRISVSKAGVVISFLNSREIGEEKLDYEEAAKAANSFLESRGIKGMKESYYVISDGMCTINYAYESDKVLYYPDLIKISVALDNGGIVEYNATGYVMNHTKRKLTGPELTQENAVKKVSPHLTVNSGRLALVPTPGLNEVLCYEFQCKGKNGERVLVYINAQTGMEEQIFIVEESDTGILVK